MPFFSDLARMLGQQGPVAWDAARQLAHSIATGGESESNVDPLDRISFEQLARVAELQVANATGLATSITGRGLQVVPVTRTQWVSETLDAYRPLFERLAGSLGSGATPPPGTGSGHPSLSSDEIVLGDPTLGEPDGDPSAAWLSGLMQMLTPMMLGMTAGSMVGHLATRSFGQYDLPLPRQASDTIHVLVGNLDAFGTEWTIERDDLRLWLCLHEVVHHAVIGVPHVRARLTSLIERYVAGFEADPNALEDRIGELDPMSMEGMAGFQSLFNDPEALLGATQSATQRELLPQIEALVCAVVGYVDHVMDKVGGPLISGYGAVTEAMRRRRVEAGDADRFVERLFGLELTQERYDRGAAFVDGIVERAGATGLERLWRDEQDLPTPNEVDAPGLWLARIDLPGD